jgi:hypothetical protein
LDASSKYELLQRIAGVKIVVFRGRETSGGQSVLLHQLTEPNDHTVVLKRALQYLLINPASAGGRILDLVEIQGGNFLVTLDQPECLALREWLDWELDGPKPAPSPSPSLSPVPSAPPPAAVTSEPGEFTQLFRKAAPSTVRAEERPALETAGPGEFTQLFQRSGQSQRTDPPQPLGPSVAPSMPMAPTPPASDNQPGEFTRLFRSPLATPSEASREPLPVGSPSQNAPGEFTRIFGAGTPRGGSAPSAPPTAPSAAPPSMPGSLTESLEPRQSAPAMTPPAPAGPGEFTRVIGLPSSAATPAFSAAPSSPPPPAAAPSFAMPAIPAAPALPAAPQAPHAPQMPQAPEMPHAPSMPAPPALAIPAPAPAPSSGRPPMALIILFAILILAAFALILFVILRR